MRAMVLTGIRAMEMRDVPDPKIAAPIRAALPESVFPMASKSSRPTGMANGDFPSPKTRSCL